MVSMERLGCALAMPIKKVESENLGKSDTLASRPPWLWTCWQVHTLAPQEEHNIQPRPRGQFSKHACSIVTTGIWLEVGWCIACVPSCGRLSEFQQMLHL